MVTIFSANILYYLVLFFPTINHKSTFSIFIGSLVLKIPWKNLYGAPVEATIQDLYLLVVPNQQVKYDATKEEKRDQQSKQTELQRIEEVKRKEAEKGLYLKSSKILFSIYIYTFVVYHVTLNN